MMKKLLNKGLCILLSVMVVTGTVIIGGMKTSAAAYDGRDIEVTLAADAVSNNLDLTGFSEQLRSELTAKYQIPADKVHIKTVDSSSASTTGFVWDTFDHTNVSTNAKADSNNKIVYYNDTNYDPNWQTDGNGYIFGNALNQPYHIAIGTGGDFTFYGYGKPAFKDFLYTPNTTADNKIINFTINESSVSYHSFDAAGFLFDANYTYNSSTAKRTLSGYLVLLGQTNAYIYELKGIDVDLFTQEQSQTISSITSTTGGSYWGGTVKLISKATKPAAVNNYRYLKLAASATNVSLYQFTDNTYSTASTGGVIFKNVTLPETLDSFGFGPLASYTSHDCGKGTVVTYSNITMTEDNSVGFADLVRSTTWQYPDSMKLIVNVDNDGVDDFGDTAKLSSILYYTMLNNAHYIGWGLNNTISGSTTVASQANGFISCNYGKGTFINRSDAATSSLSEGVDAIATYIGGQLGTAATIDKPTIVATFDPNFNTNQKVTCSAKETKTSAGNPIGAYEWKYLDVASGSWYTQSSGDPSHQVSSAFTFNSQSYNVVSLRIQDSVTGLWSDYSDAFIATATGVAPISQFSVDPNILMPDTSISALKTGTTVTATDSSYLPNGGQIKEWDWTVCNASLVNIPALAKTYTSYSGTNSFNFSGQPAGTYTIKLVTKDGTSPSPISSPVYSQQVTIYKESGLITITSASSSTTPIVYTGTKTFDFSISSTAG
ncbi:MAG: S-layer protein, partial [Clostridia bacterium]|nr:S-layer protein [Clostridia bacterium]